MASAAPIFATLGLVKRTSTAPSLRVAAPDARERRQAYMRAYYATHREAMKARSRASQEARKEERRAYQREWARRKRELRKYRPQ